MKRLKLFFACLLMAVLSIGQVWAVDPEVFDFSTSTSSGSGNTLQLSWEGTSCTIVQTKGESTSNVNSTYNGTNLRWYASHYVTFTPKTNVTISKVVLVGKSGKTGQTMTKTENSGAASITTTASTFTTEVTGAWTPSSPLQLKMGSQFQLTSVTITYAVGGGDCSNTVTVSKVIPEHGDFTLSATEVCGDDAGGEVSITNIEPATGYELDDISATVGTVDKVSNKVTGITANTSITVTFKEKQKYTVTWSNNGVTSTSQVYEGEKPVFPATPAACDATSTTFIGWATAPWTGKSADLSEKTVYTSASAMPDVTGAVTYYAVFAKSSGSAGNLFEWEGGTSSALTALENVTASGLGSDYAESNAPYRVKFDTEGDYIVITTSGAIESVAVGVKMLGGGSTSHIYVQEAEDAESDFSAVETLTISGAQNDVLNLETENAFKADSRAVKLLFNKGANVGVGPITIAGAASASDYMTTCCTKYNITIADGIEHGSISADLASACEGTTVTITFSPAGGYHLDSWSVNGTEQDVAENTFTMPAAAVEVSATFEHDPCSNLDAPTLNGDVAVTYNSATINWNTLTNASSYDVAVVRHSDSESIFSGNVNALTKALAGLDPETQYDYSIMGVGDGSTYCTSGNGVLAGNFTTDALPTAHLTLIDPSGTHASSGDYTILTPFNLPSTAAYCAKTFMGWDPDDECATAPTYTKGQSFTFENTTGVTLYAVYADVTGGSSNTTNIAYSGVTTNMTGANDAATFGLDADDWSVVGVQGGSAQNVGLNKDGSFRLYYNADGNSAIQIEAPQTVTSVALTFTEDTYNNAYVKVGENLVALEDGVYPINATSFEIGNANTSNVQVRISNIAVNFVTPGTPSNYSTTCAAAPEVIVGPEEVNVSAAAVAAGVIEAAYDNVDEENLSVALFNDQACTEAFDGGWLTASINGDKNIAYAITEYTSYAIDRKAYIQLTAPASSTGVADAVVVIPVTQAKKAAVFASLEELVASDAPANSNVTVSFSNVTIKSIYYYPNTSSENNRKGVVFNIQKAGEDIKIYYNAKVSEEWVPGGTLTGTLTDCPWKIYSEAWQLAPAGEWAWNNLTYNDPPEVASIEIRNDATNKTYIDGQVFNPAGLSVIAIYDNSNEEDVTTYATWSYDPEKLSEGDTEVEVTAEYSGKSDTKTITGLTVNPIPNKTIAEFIAAGGTRCYLEGTVSNIKNTTYGNFDLTDANATTIYVYGCLTPSGESAQFNTLGVSAGDKIKVIAEQYMNHPTSGDEAVNVVFVSKVSPVVITIADKTLENGQSWTIEATTDPEGAVANISYEIKTGSDDCITLVGNVITATADAGTATIIASIPDGEGYLANSVEFTVTAAPAGSVKDVVILAKYDGQWYALMNEAGSANNSLNALAVDYSEADGVLLDVEQPSAITWSRSIADGKATFLNGTKYITGGTGNTNLTLGDAASEWTIDEAGHYMKGTRTFLFYKDGYFKNYASSNAGGAQYSDYPVVLAAPQFLNREVVRENLFDGKWGTVCPTKEVKYPTGASFYTLTYKEEQDGVPYKVFFDEIAEGASLVAGKPYLFIADGDAIKGVKVGDAATEGENDYNGFHGILEAAHTTLTVTAQDEADHKYYIVYGNEIRLCGAGSFNVPVERAYLEMSAMPTDAVAPMPGRRRVCLTNQAAQTVTGIDALNASETPVKMIIDGKMYILRGEKMYDATGRLVK